jgi:RNA polymerase sigma-70 factor (ECF subfamily)
MKPARTAQVMPSELLVETNSSLVARAQAGDPAALKALVRAEGPKVAGLLVRILGPRQDLEDLVQTVFLELCRALPGFRGESSLSTFVGGITVRVARRARRPSAWQRRCTEWPAEEPRSEDPDAEAQLRARRQLRRLHLLLEDIPEKKRIAFLLWAVDGRTAEEVAEMTRCTLSTARKRIYDVRGQLRRRAQEDPELRHWVIDETP